MAIKRYFSFNNNSLLYISRIIVGCIIVWWSLYYLHDSRKIWALISVIAVSEPDIENLRKASFARIINTVTGCSIGLLFIYFTGITFGSLMAAIIVSVIISTSFRHYPTSWKLAPTTVAIVMVPSIIDRSTLHDAMVFSLQRTGEILFGTLVAFLLGLLFHWVRTTWERRKVAALEKLPEK